MPAASINGVSRQFKEGERLVDVLNRCGVTVRQVCYHPRLGPIQTCAAQSQQAVNALRNAIIFGKMMGSMNPELMQCIASAVGETMGSERRPVIDPPGLFSLLGQCRRPELRRSVALINRFLETLGSRLKEKGCSPGPKS
jgi:hypothetical protein